MSITNDNARRVFALEIAGLIYRYHSIKPPATTNLNSLMVAGISYDDTEAIVSIGAFNSSIDPAGGVAEYGSVSIELSILKNGLNSDPGVVFGRIGKRSDNINRANLESDITFDALPQTINLDSDLSSLSVPRLMHVGAETFKVTSFTSSSMTISNRAVGDSQYQSHRIDSRSSMIPFTEDQISTFRGRRCKLYVANKDSGENVGDYTCIINGFIESSPYVENGSSINLSIMPITALLDTELSDQRGTSSFLLQDKHYFFKNRSNVFEFGSAFRKQYFMYTLSNAQQNASDNTKTDFDVDTPDYPIQNIYDVTRSNGESDQATLNHPRYPFILSLSGFIKIYPETIGTVIVSGSTKTRITSIHTVDGATSQADLIAAINAGGFYAYIEPRGEIKRLKLADDDLKDWPEIINEKLSVITTHTGTDGAFSTFKIRNNQVRGTTLSDHRNDHEGLLHFWYSSEWYRTSRNYKYAYWKNANLESRARLSNSKRVFYPLDFWNDGTKPNNAGNSLKIRTLEFPNQRSTSSFININVSPSYKQANEPGILCESSLNLPTSATAGVYYGIQVETYDYERQRLKTLYYQATHEESLSTGFLIHLRQNRENFNQGHFGDWNGNERTIVKRGVSEYFVSPGEMMLKILQSGGGGNNGNYDNLGFGLSIHEDNIDIDSFLKNGTRQIEWLSRGFSVDDFNPRDFFDSLLKSIGCILIMKRSSAGVPKISLQSIGTESESFVSSTIAAGDWLVDPPPIWSTYDDIVTQVEIDYDWNNDENKFQEKVIFNNQESINRYSGEKSKINIELYGLRSIDIGSGAGDAFNYFLPIASRIFNVLSDPMRLWKGDIGTGKSIFLDVGSYVKCSSPHFKDIGDEYGVTNKIGMIKSINQELMSEGCEIEIVRTGISVTNWNSTLLVTFVLSSNQLTISTNTYSDDDTVFFQSGDVVDFLPFGDEDNSTNGLIIDSISGSTLTFTAGHGITTLGTIEPTTYLNASSDHRIDAYLSTASGVLGTNDKSKEYA
jgi:hypothetical protein